MSEKLEKTVITLRPIAMTVPNSQNIYSLSQIDPEREMEYDIFLELFAGRSVEVSVSLDPDGLSNPTREKAYGIGFDCWWIVAVD